MLQHPLGFPSARAVLVASVALALALPTLLGPVPATAAGPKGTAIDITAFTFALCLKSAGELAVDGTITVQNTGPRPTVGLSVALHVQGRFGSGPWTDVSGTDRTLTPSAQLLPGQSVDVPFQMDLALSAGKAYRFAAHATILNHPARPGQPFGPHTYARFPDGYPICGVGGTNQPPNVTILSPADNTIVAHGVPVTFSATAFDAEDADLSGIITWSYFNLLDPSGGTTIFYTGPTFAAMLPEGVHVVSASVTDTGGLTSIAQINIEVQPPAIGLAVTAATAGNPGVLVYSVTVDGITQSVAVNGSTTFTALSAQTYSVELTGVPAGCTVQGSNPRLVSAPGSTTFQVDCLPPPPPPDACLTPPFSASLDILRDEYQPQDGGSGSRSISAHEFGELQVSASSTAPPPLPDDDRYGPYNEIRIGWTDPFLLVPLDSTRLGEPVSVTAHVSGSIVAEGTDRQKTWVVAEVWFSDEQALLVHHQRIFGGNLAGGQQSFFQEVTLQARLGSWSGHGGWAHAQAGSWNGATGTASARIQLQGPFVVRDAAGDEVPMQMICTGSGTVY